MSDPAKARAKRQSSCLSTRNQFSSGMTETIAKEKTEMANAWWKEQLGA